MTDSVQLSSWTLGLLVERLLVMPKYELCESDADVDHYRSVGPTSTTISGCVRIRRQLGCGPHRGALQVRQDALEPQSVRSRRSFLAEWGLVRILRERWKAHFLRW